MPRRSRVQSAKSVGTRRTESAQCEGWAGEIVARTAAYSRDDTTTETTAHDRILAERARYVSAGVSTPKLVVSHADGARVTDVDGRTFIDFAGGIGCQNTGHRFAPVVDAIKAQADEYLHQCFMVGVYEPYVEVCRRLAELSPCAGRAAEVDPRQLGRRGGRERGQDRARRRPGGPPSSSSTTRSTAARC